MWQPRSARSWWSVGSGVVIGAALFVGAALGGQPWLGLLAFAIVTVFSVGLLLIGRRSETVRGLLDHRDERLSAIDVRATASAGAVLILVVIGGAVVELARGRSGEPYTWLGAIAGLTYVGAVVVARLRG